MNWFKRLTKKKKNEKSKTTSKAKKQTSSLTIKTHSNSETKPLISIQEFSTPSSPNKKEHFQRHFRKFHSPKTTGHPSYVFGEENRNYKIIGMTRAKITNGIENVPLNRNPEPNSKIKAYLRPKTDKINKGVKNERLKGWSFSDSDKKKVQNIIDKDN